MFLARKSTGMCRVPRVFSWVVYTRGMFDLGLRGIGVILVSILLSMGLHEAMHAFAAHALGDTTAKDAGRLTLNPLKHVDILTTVLLPLVLIILHQPPIFVARPVPFDPDRVRFGEYGAALVGLAGPFTNFILAVLAAMLVRFMIPAGSLADDLVIFTGVNLSFFVFNMIPLPPLDGSRLLYSVAPEPVQRVMYRLETAGFGVMIVILLVLSPFIVPLVSHMVNSIGTFLLPG